MDIDPEMREARETLSDAKLIAFFRAAREKSEGLAVELINQELDASKSLDEILVGSEDAGFTLEVQVDEAASEKYSILFGYSPGAGMCAGESWEVDFRGDSVISAKPVGFWRS